MAYTRLTTQRPPLGPATSSALRPAALAAMVSPARRSAKMRSGRQLSLAMGSDANHIGQLLEPPAGKSRAMPTPDELRLIAPLLRVPLVELLEAAWGISRDELEDEIATMAAHSGTLAADWDELTAGEREAVREFLSYVGSKLRARQAGAAELMARPDQGDAGGSAPPASGPGGH